MTGAGRARRAMHRSGPDLWKTVDIRMAPPAARGQDVPASVEHRPEARGAAPSFPAWRASAQRWPNRRPSDRFDGGRSPDRAVQGGSVPWAWLSPDPVSFTGRNATSFGIAKLMEQAPRPGPICRRRVSASFSLARRRSGPNRLNLYPLTNPTGKSRGWAQSTGCVLMPIPDS